MTRTLESRDIHRQYICAYDPLLTYILYAIPCMSNIYESQWLCIGRLAVMPKLTRSDNEYSAGKRTEVGGFIKLRLNA